MGTKDLTDDQWIELIRRAPDDSPKRRKPTARDRRIYGEAHAKPITLPRLKFLERLFEDT